MCMNKVVSPNQTGFIPSRNFQENIIVAQELLHNMNKLKGKNEYFTIKVDLAKAYDMLNWKYVEEVLKKMCIPQNLTCIIMPTITIVNMRVIWNGQRGDYFKLKKGFHQGYLISPYLFFLCIDKLSHMIMDVVDKKELECMKVGRRGPRISHFMFANDLILFGKATEQQVTCIMKVLKKFCEVSG
ncbi:unnamed protein product [Lathyrus sativus]|nr:unnamed protein product [Lathyrus sativus]